ncbi:MAG TPA: glycosyltransferase family 4 protein [Phycisphaeraceae bacterium]
MHVALVANMSWLDEELLTFQYLVVGLIDEQVRVAQVVPEQWSTADLIAFSERVTWQESGWPALDRYRLAHLGKRLEELGVDLLHALDGRLWHGVARLANAINLPAVFSANSHLDVRLMESTARQADPLRCAFTATTEPIAQAMRDRVDPAYLVQTISPGAHLGPEALLREPGEPVCVVVTGNGRMDARYQALLEAMAAVVQADPQTQFFLDGQGGDQHMIWQAASRLGLLRNLSFIPRRLGHREILLRADVLVQPQPLGRTRGLMIQAMARGIPVLAHEDPWLDCLIDGQTCRLLHGPDRQAWQEALMWVVEQPQEAYDLGQRARAWIQEHRLAAKQIAKVMDLYRRVTGATIPFPAGG